MNTPTLHNSSSVLSPTSRVTVIVNGPVIMNQGTMAITKSGTPSQVEVGSQTHEEPAKEATAQNTQTETKDDPSKGHSMLEVIDHLHAHFEAEKAAIVEQINAMEHQANVKEHIDSRQKNNLSASVDVLKNQLAQLGDVHERLGRLRSTLSGLSQGTSTKLSHTDQAVLSTAPALLHDTRALLTTKRNKLTQATLAATNITRGYQEAAWLAAGEEAIGEVMNGLDNGVNDILTTLGIKAKGVAPGTDMGPKPAGAAVTN